MWQRFPDVGLFAGNKTLIKILLPALFKTNTRQSRCCGKNKPHKVQHKVSLRVPSPQLNKLMIIWRNSVFLTVNFGVDKIKKNHDRNHLYFSNLYNTYPQNNNNKKQQNKQRNRGSPDPVIAHLAQIGHVVLENSIIYQRMGG